MTVETKNKGWPQVAITLLWGALWMIPGQGQAADNLSFKGNLVAEPCTIRPGDEAIFLEFRDVSSKYLYFNSRTIGQPFQIHLENCDTGIADSVTARFSGVENATLPGLLAVDGGSVASGIAIGLETPEGKPLPLNVASAEQALDDGANMIALKAYVRGEPQAIANEAIDAGRFTATSTFTLEYP